MGLGVRGKGMWWFGRGIVRVGGVGEGLGNEGDG